VQKLILARDAAMDIAGCVLQFRAELSKNAEPAPDGKEVGAFLKGLRDGGRTVVEIAKLTNLTEGKVRELLAGKPDRSDL
jgi:hypothetical protein